MSSKNPNEAVSPDDGSGRIRKYLWGAHRNKQKVLALLEMNLDYLRKSLSLKRKHSRSLESRPAGDPVVLDRLMQNNREIGWMEREVHKLETMRGLLTTPDNPWPKAPRPAPPASPPEAASPARPESAARKPGKAAPPSSSKIMIIEDESIIIKSVSYFLLQENYRVLFSLNDGDGFQQTLENRPDLILLDIMMPGMNGYQFLARLKKDPRVSSIPVIILSSLSRESDILEGLEKGAADYITKPFSLKVLLSKIKKILTAQNEHPPHPGHD